MESADVGSLSAPPEAIEGMVVEESVLEDVMKEVDVGVKVIPTVIFRPSFQPGKKTSILDQPMLKISPVPKTASEPSHPLKKQLTSRALQAAMTPSSHWAIV